MAACRPSAPCCRRACWCGPSPRQRGQPRQQDPSHQPHEAQLLTLNSDKAMDLLGWKPKWSLDTTLEYIADSYKKFDSANQLRQSMDQQIEEYMKK